MTRRDLPVLLGHWLACCLPLLLVLGLLRLSIGSDAAVDVFFRAHRAAHPLLHRLFTLASDWGNLCLYAPAAATLILAWRRGNRPRVRYWLTFAALQFLLCFLVVRIAKISLGVPRPDASNRLPEPWTFDASHHARPSGHTAEIFGQATALTLDRPARWKTLLLACFGTAVAFSRIYLSWHSPSDVFFGLLVGATVGIFCPVLMDVDWKGLVRAARNTR
ncbi:phosphoesterase PA-phosphatase related protein [Desulfovibrio sp. X2]|nr:phosphoesterase PA-phosphatase related protein [Desulfovibrio sp. X2]